MIPMEFGSQPFSAFLMVLRDLECFDMSSEALYVHCEVYAQVKVQEDACSP